LPSDWVTVSPTNVSLNVGASSTLNIVVTVPSYATPADYKLTITLKNSQIEESSFTIVRVKNYPSGYDKPIVTRTVQLYYDINKTHVNLDVNSPVRSFPLVQVQEEIPKVLASSASQVQFNPYPDEIIQSDPIVQWDLKDLAINQSKDLSYLTNGILDNLATYIYMPLKELTIVETKLPTGLKIVDLSVSPLSVNESSTGKLVVQNIGNTPKTLDFSMQLPAGWRMEPQRINATLQPNEQREIDFSVIVPSDAVQGDHIGTAIIVWGGDTYIREMVMHVGPVYTMWIYAGIIFAVAAVAYLFFRYRIRLVSYERPMVYKLQEIQTSIQARPAIEQEVAEVRRLREELGEDVKEKLKRDNQETRGESGGEGMKGLIFIAVLLLMPVALAQTNPNGRITGLTYSPTELVALSDATLTVSVQNPSSQSQSYYMQIQVTKNGNVVNEQDFTFALDSIKSISFNPTFVPQDIGELDVVVRLYDKFKINLYDTKVTKLNVVSHLGPFDIIIDPLTNVIRPSYLLPIHLTLENMGTRGTDASVQLSINCPTPVTQSLTVFLPGGNTSERLVSMQSCRQEGLYDITASIVIFNQSWVSSSSQFAVNSSYIQLDYTVPDTITLEPEQTYSFLVEVTNSGNQKITELYFVIQQIPLSWQETSPVSVNELDPGQKALFLVNITVPSDAAIGSYPLRMDAAANEALERKFSTLNVISASATLPNIPASVPSTYTLVLILAISAVGIGIYFKKRRVAPVDMQKLQMLRQLKETVQKRKRE
jgi:uncharacterized membrane protein